MIRAPDEDAAEATLEQVANAVVGAVERTRVAAIQEAHAARKVRLRRAHDEVVVIAHQAVRQAFPAAPANNLTEQVDESSAIVVVHVNRLALDATCHDVINAAGDVWARLTGHSRISVCARKVRPTCRAPERSGPARSGPARSGPARSGPARSGPARSGPARSGPARSGPARRSVTGRHFRRLGRPLVSRGARPRRCCRRGRSGRPRSRSRGTAAAGRAVRCRARPRTCRRRGSR